MVRGPGDGWVTCSLGHRHWGVEGAAGLLVTRMGPDSRREVLLQHRAAWTHEGDTWGVTGGARRPGESAVSAALREAHEEVGISAASVRVSGLAMDDHGTWAYRTVVAEALVADPTDLDVAASVHETSAVAWVVVEDVVGLRLHPGFAAAWSNLRRMLPGLQVVVDAANVVGSTPDGWWRDRVGATERLLERLCVLAERGVPAWRVPGGTGLAGPGAPELWHPRFDVVVEGRVAAVPAVTSDGAGSVRVTRAPAEGDDEVVRRVLTLRPTASTVVVVTADRALATRCREAGAAVVGPRWLQEAVEGYGT